MERGKNMRIFCGVDPGVSTGLAIGSFESNDEPDFSGVSSWTLGPARGASEELVVARQIHEMVLARRCGIGGVAVLAIEDFILTRLGSSDRDGLAPVRVTAHLEGLCIGDPRISVVKFSPASAKGIVNDERLKNWGCWKRGKPHERDAIRQLIMAVRQSRRQTQS
jgi:hypothetical protein